MAGAVTPAYYGFKSKTIRKDAEPLIAPASSAGAMVTQASGAAASVVITPPTVTPDIVGVAIDRIDCAYLTAVPSGAVSVTDGTNTWGPFPITISGTVTFVFDPPMLFLAGAAVTVSMVDGSVTKSLYVRSFVQGSSHT